MHDFSTKMNPKTAVLLVGGHSTRMGSDKFLLKINGKPQWEFMVDELNIFFDKVYISCRPDQAKYFEGQLLIIDKLENIGPMGAIHAAFHQLKNEDSLFFVACDLPNFTSSLSAKLYTQLSSEYDVVAALNPSRNSAEPLVAFWSKSALPAINQFIAEKNYALFKCMSKLRVKAIPIDDGKLLNNVNSPHDL